MKDEFVKRSLVIQIVSLSLFLAICCTAFGTIIAPLDYSKDNIEARITVQGYAFVKLTRAEYDNLLRQICLLRYDEVTSCFGEKLAKPPTDCVLPLFAGNASARGGYTLNPDKSHTDFNAIGDLGYIEFFYNSDGESIGDAALYFRADDQFTPLQSTNDYRRRVAWEMTKFSLIKNWLNEHVLKVKDLGTVEVTNSPSGSISSIGNRIEISEGKTCVIDFRANPLITAQQATTNENFYVDLYLSPTNSAEQFLEIHSVRSHKSVVFMVNGQFYRITLKQKVSSSESAPTR